MEENLITPEVGSTCPALSNENYEYHLFDDAGEYCICNVTEKPCIGRVVIDIENRSSRFFAKGKCMINVERLNNCPLFGAPKNVVKEVIKARNEKELNKKIKKL